MIVLILKSYLSVLIAIGAGAFGILFLGFYFIFRKSDSFSRRGAIHSRHPETQNDFVMMNDNQSLDPAVKPRDDVLEAVKPRNDVFEADKQWGNVFEGEKQQDNEVQNLLSRRGAIHSRHPEVQNDFTMANDSDDVTPNVESIAGDNMLATQLDLARAYIEIGRLQLAKKILNQVATTGDSQQQHEAQTLLEMI